MKPEAQRLAIAEECGWTHFEFGPWDGYPFGIIPGQSNPAYKTRVPDFINDLNAMHEAEKVLNEKQQVWYLQKLTQIRYKAGVSGMIGCMIDKTTFATAAQRAEAWLKALNLWREE